MSLKSPKNEIQNAHFFPRILFFKLFYKIFVSIYIFHQLTILAISLCSSSVYPQTDSKPSSFHIDIVQWSSVPVEMRRWFRAKVKYRVRPEQSMPGKGFLHQQYQKHKEVNNNCGLNQLCSNGSMYSMTQKWTELYRLASISDSYPLLNVKICLHQQIHLGGDFDESHRLRSSPDDCIALCSSLHMRLVTQMCR